MARISVLLLAVTIILGAVKVMAADGNIRTCTLTRVIQCVPDEGCEELSVQEMELPRFVRIDLKSKIITSLDKDLERSTKIATVEHQNGLTILHGTELRGWSIALGDVSGNLTLSAAGEGEGFVVFGACIRP